MSTRCVVTVTDEYQSFSIYRHSDGYPGDPATGNLGVLCYLVGALDFAWPLPRFEAGDFAAAIVRGWKDDGGHIYLTTGRDAHGDLEYHYDIRQPANRKYLTVQVSRPVRDNKGYNTTGWCKVGKPHRLPAAGPLGELARDAAEKIT